MKNRAVIEKVYPIIEQANYPIKRTPGETVKVNAHIFGDGHDVVNARILYKTVKSKTWQSSPLSIQQNDEWSGEFFIEKNENYLFTVEAWIDHVLDWHHGTLKKLSAGENIKVELMIGEDLLTKVAKKVKGNDAKYLKDCIKILKNNDTNQISEILNEFRFYSLLLQNSLVENSTVYHLKQEVEVETGKAIFSSWYEFFPRSSGSHVNKHGTFKDCHKVVDFVEKMGFDVIYFPPVHPLGESHRKGKNNAVNAQSGEPGSPWAIGNKLGGHKAIHPELGTMKDFENLVKYAKQKNIDIALDIAFQASPDHPYVKEKPQWFKWRPDGTVQYAENPPKKYQDVLPFNFETDDWKNLWEELTSVFTFWAEKGVKIFRVDNPHTKPFAFWEYAIKQVKKKYPGTIFLSEAFTRPKIMARLARLGFTQSYTYFTWRHTKEEITQYMHELTHSELREYFRPNFWPNTPDILPYYLQNKGIEDNAIRIALAATLSSNYGIYGPVFDLLETKPIEGKEEYLDSEKYEIRVWDWETMTPFRKFISLLNKIRKENPALQYTHNIEFLENDNAQFISFYKKWNNNHLYIVINLDPVHKQAGYCKLPAHCFDGKTSVKVHDLITDEHYNWNKEWNYVELNPKKYPLHVFKIDI